MSAGSGASNLGYANIHPINSSPYVNGASSNYAGNFSSNEIPGLPGLAGAKSNIDAAASRVPGICMKGGAKTLKRKIKNITRYYKKMKAGSRKLQRIKRRLRSRAASRQYAGGSHRRSLKHRPRRSRRHRGGYAQYQNNMPMTNVYSTGSVNLPASELALANPPPITPLNNCVNCVDNYNHYTNSGFPSKGH